MTTRFHFFVVGVLFVWLSGCTSGPKYQTQKYAQLKAEQTFEREFSKVWMALEKVLENQNVIERDPSKIENHQLNDLEKRSLKTDWVYGTSKDKYVEYKVNGFPRRKYLPIRFQYQVTVTSVTGGTHVKVLLNEQIQELDEHGKPRDYQSVKDFDSSRARDLLDQVRLALYAQ